MMETQRAASALLRSRRTTFPGSFHSALHSRRALLCRSDYARTAFTSLRSLSSTSRQQQEDALGPILQPNRGVKQEETRRKQSPSLLFTNNSRSKRGPSTTHLDGFDAVMNGSAFSRPTRTSSAESRKFLDGNFGKDWSPKPLQSTQPKLEMHLLDFGTTQSAPGLTSALSPGLEPQKYSYPRLYRGLGREVKTPGGSDLQKAITTLTMIVTKNKIRATHLSQKFHERAGMKRKRLKSVRWRRRFAQGFSYVTRRVQRFVNQGW
ncbi:hypothetical protein EJ05DRAFT_471865 [Pseudovirgaria hyperparasitica]|uniref:Ribosomal protein S21 n=1 Tax=Pseudovirgaria hyperparasitica TaxID=470096 RepID=A0A6A6WL22_9PEZI|nr:uncharacterized protein EJ05DRAFT_471865 [Pseudovirgaria hyperparasitica]KAF2762900.1 hypothetical protein EJ05DRAFT_471865 [Pseudovirgaria hyperparasitica]